ncbi:hypothetical protein AB0D34_46505, partial [Streptomyces sp. NPDC048420]|uniref:hypothetical protein n=1 Tax=Streptomyces sp. NPDC048420 TaxID=3155755 RepID=UPI00341C5BE4
MNWRTYWQRLGVLMLLTILVLGLIKAGMEPYLSLAIATGIVMLMRDFLRSDEATDDQRKQVSERPMHAVQKTPNEDSETDAEKDSQ